jgi:hypothetical protein
MLNSHHRRFEKTEAVPPTLPKRCAKHDLFYVDEIPNIFYKIKQWDKKLPPPQWRP